MHESSARHKSKQASWVFPYSVFLLPDILLFTQYRISDRSEQETDHNFAEPGLFVVNEHGNLHVVDISNNPFVRPELGALSRGLAWIRNPDNNYPIRGTLDY